ncbi:ATP10 protein-domain-containing protein [Daedaleopsis nitida]|nr:ATP10 protein-domain-containing protein [Daedaleopsis nitida]
MRPTSLAVRSHHYAFTIRKRSGALRNQHRLISTPPQPQSHDPGAATTSTVESKGKERESAPKTKSSSATPAAANVDDALPLLQRPLGVRKQPKAKSKSWDDTKEKFIDQDKRLEERTHLAREATRGYFADLSATRRHGGKTWIAPKVMIREDRALYFPDIFGTPLAGNQQKVHTTDLLQGKVSVVALLTTRMSEIHTAQCIEPTLQAFESNSMFQLVQINLQDNLMKSFLVSFFASGIRKSVPETLWPTYMISSQNMEYLREPLGIANKHVGYIYLVDPNMKVRWAACADPKSEEVAALKTCTTVLLNRIAKARDTRQEDAPESLSQQET